MKLVFYVLMAICWIAALTGVWFLLFHRAEPVKFISGVFLLPFGSFLGMLNFIAAREHSNKPVKQRERG